ncbi:MAG: hypothetical protein JO360_12210 [Acidobacteria bacterium]|nr:hypothetical protein [Acidobacteriota bacterium]
MFSTAHNKYITGVASLLLLSSIFIFSGCGHANSGELSFSSHKVSLRRHGITNRFGVEERGESPVFRYDGYSLHGDRLQVKIENEKVSINEKQIGMLKQGDSIHIGDEGLRVNSLDYGQTEKYLQQNLQPETSQNIAK